MGINIAMDTHKKHILWMLAASGALSVAAIARAASYTALESLPGVTTAGSPVPSFANYLAGVFNLALGVAIVLAIIVLVIAGIQYIGGASNEAVRKDARDRIWGAIIGLLIALGSFLLLQTINPDISSTTVSPPSVNPTPVTPIPFGGGGAPATQYCFEYEDGFGNSSSSCSSTLSACTADLAATQKGPAYTITTPCYSN
ncbi:MAG: hypothetical protein GWM98_08350 [Nitrospinaceae bacterium]|nr:hypothetical protein [Nitrospinaceae bacterium]NIR54505.1 hypothetical protein [Nitrospinaceae bacterium]NIS84924.1 hypothetical protein [Nitrospinaceae bacterium]NIU44007.1 hypothetical protein [Nitrospinaceae bacterium]NIU96120.1 hypothetical protein [Nitrospinaceae bacterium]